MNAADKVFTAIYIALLCVAAFLIGRNAGVRETRTEAAQHGAGEWRADVYGHATFSWKEPRDAE